MQSHSPYLVSITTITTTINNIDSNNNTNNKIHTNLRRVLYAANSGATAFDVDDRYHW